MEGKVQLASFRLADLKLNIMDSPISHDFDFTASPSLFYGCVFKTN